MATGAPGTNGVWQYGEDDSEATFSALLNKAASTTDTQIGLDRARLTALEATGRIIQVVTGTTSTFVSNNTATYVDTGLTATITPTSSSNQILVLVHHVSMGKSSGSTTCVQIHTLRNGTPILNSGDGLAYGVNSEMRGVGYHDSILDSPATTSAVTYKTQFRQPQVGGGAAWANVGANNPTTSRIILIEVTP